MKKKLGKKLLSGALALALVATSIITGVSGASKLNAANETVTSLKGENTTNQATLLAGTKNPLNTGDLKTTIQNYKKTYLLGVAADFCVFLEDYFEPMDSDAEGRVAIGGDYYPNVQWGNLSYAVGAGDFWMHTPLDELMPDRAGSATIIVGGEMRGPFSDVYYDEPYVNDKSHTQFNNTSFRTKYEGAYSGNVDNHGNDVKNATKQTSKKLVINMTQDAFDNFKADTSNEEYIKATGSRGGEGNPDGYIHYVQGTNDNDPLLNISESGGYAWQKVNETQTYVTELFSFKEQFDYLEKVSGEMAERTDEATTSVSYNPSTNTITFEYTGDEEYAECIYFTLEGDEYENWLKATNIVYKNIPCLPGVEKNGSEPKKDAQGNFASGASVVNNDGTPGYWPYSYIVVNVEAAANCTEAHSNNVGKHLHVTGNGGQNTTTTINGENISNEGNDWTNNKPGVASLLYNYSQLGSNTLVLGKNCQGTIFAPRAHVTDEAYVGGNPGNRGHLSGALIAKSFKGYTEFGYRPFSGPADMLTTSVVISKVDAANHNTKLSGAKFELYKGNKATGTPVATWTSDGKTTWTVDDLEVDEEYTLHEVTPPTGYDKLKSDIVFTVDLDGEITIVSGTKGEYGLANKSQELDVYNTKTETTTKATTETTTEATTKATTEATTEATTKATTEATTAETTTRATTETTTSTTTTEEVTTTEQVSTEEDEKGGLVIVVTDEETGDRVPNATVTVTDSEGNSTDYVTDENGTITIVDLEEGDYDITVKKVPEGYKITTGETSTVHVENGKTSIHEAYIVPSGDSTEDTTEDTTSTSQTKTGDAFNIIIPVAMILVSLAGIVVIAIRRRKRY